MNYIDLPKPHGYLIWRGKQRAIASPVMLPAGEKLLVVSDDEAFGEVVLSSPAKVNIAELEKHEEGYHCLRPETRKLLWPEAEAFFVHEFKEWLPFEAAKMVEVNNGTVEFIENRPLSEAQKQLLEKANRLPKTIVLLDDAVVWNGDGPVIQDGLSEKVKPILDVVLEDAKSEDLALSLYQLALVRPPKFRLEKKSYKSEAVKAMPYKAQMNHPECDEDKPVGLVNKQTGKLAGCHEDTESAMAQAEAIMAEEEGKGRAPKKAGRKKELAEGEKCDDMMMPMPMMGGATTFADMMAMEEAQEAMGETQKLTNHFGMLASNIMASPDIADKGAALKALAEEYAGLVSQAMAEKALSEETKAEGLGGYLVSDEEGDHLPTQRNGKVDHRLMGAAWAALHGGYRGNKYEGPGKQEAIRKLKALYKREGLDTPGEKGLDTDEDEKAGRRMRTTMMDKLKAAWSTIKEIMDWAQEPDDDEEIGMTGFSKGYGIAIKTVNGEPWLITYSTNAFEDREGEIFSTKSLEQYVSQAEAMNDRGFFNLWHITTKANPDLSDIAEIKWQGVIGRFLVETGPFLKDEKGQAALKFFTRFAKQHPVISPEGWGCSPEYRYLPEERKTGIYENIWKTRTSILPRLAAANIWTKAGVEMALNEQQKQAASMIFGEELAGKIIKSAEDATKELEEAGVAHKGGTETAATTEGEAVTQVSSLTKDDLKAELEPFAEAMTLIGEQMAKLQAKQEELDSQVKSLKKTEEIKAQAETPRATLFSFKRASEAPTTVVAEDDALKNNKPVETPKAPADTSGAAHFFPAR